MRAALAFATLRRRPSRTLLAMLGVAVSAAMLLDMVMLATGMRESFRSLLTTRGYEIRLAPRGTLPFDTDATIGNATAVIDTLETNPGIGRISPVLGASLHFPRGDSTITSAGLGLHPTVQGDYELVEGSDPTAPNAIVVNDDLLHRLGARIDDTITVAVGYDPQLRSFSGSRRLVISGRARFLYVARGQLVAALLLPTLQSMYGASRLDRVSLIMVDARAGGAGEEDVRAWIAERVPSVTAISTATAIAQVDQRLSYFRQLAFILGTVSLIVSFLLVTTLVTVSVSERVGEIAVMRAIGVSRVHVVEQIVVEGLVISVTGAIVGLGLGLLTARYLNGILAGFPGLPAAIDFFLFQPRSAWTALGLLGVSGIVAGIYPAWRGASLPIASTLRRDAV
jgi:putative ABC transport system permease protein